MADVAYKPPNEYNPAINTPPSKFPLNSSIILFGIRRVVSDSVDSNVAAATTKTVYTVPAGKTFFVCSAEFQIITEDGLTTGWFSVGSDIPNQFQVYHSTGLGGYNTKELTQQYFTPMAIQSGERIIYHVSTDGGDGPYHKYTCILIGYEIDNTLLTSLY